MKRSILSTLMILAISLTACSSFQANAVSSTQTSNDSLTNTQLAVGILKLEGTKHAVTAEQAPELLMLWQVYGDLSQSDTAAQEEVEAVIAQVQETLTANQLQAITNMQISQHDIAAVTQGMTITVSSSSSASTTIASGGGIPAGGPPDGGGALPIGGGPGDFGGTGSSIGTNQTQNNGSTSSMNGSAEIPSAVVDALIQLLQQKIAA